MFMHFSDNIGKRVHKLESKSLIPFVNQKVNMSELMLTRWVMLMLSHRLRSITRIMQTTLVAKLRSCMWYTCFFYHLGAFKIKMLE
jgi:hypothetical protein